MCPCRWRSRSVCEYAGKKFGHARGASRRTTTATGSAVAAPGRTTKPCTSAKLLGAASTHATRCIAGCPAAATAPGASVSSTTCASPFARYITTRSANAAMRCARLANAMLRRSGAHALLPATSQRTCSCVPTPRRAGTQYSTTSTA